jgi:2-aminoadipate transaminase
MQAALVAHLPTAGPLACRWQMPGGGMFFWVELPQGVDSDALLVKAIARGVAFVPGAPFFAGQARPNTLRLSFVTVSAGAIERGIAALGAALAELHDEALGGPAREQAAIAPVAP